jgi:acyl dehydratase
MNRLENIIPRYQIKVVNDALTSENKIHSDDIAKKFGFTGALVSGVSVFGHMTHPLINTYGQQWLESSIAEVRFIKPAYVDDLLSVEVQTVEDSDKNQHHITSALNQSGELLARMESWQPDQPAEAKLYADAGESVTANTREEIHWDKIHLNQFAPEYEFCVTPQQHDHSLNIMRDELSIYQHSTACVHPYSLLKECNQALMRMFILPAWIHVGSKIKHHRQIGVGEIVNVQTIPTDKWENKGHQFITLDVIFRVSGELALEVSHTAIFRISGN